MRPGEDPRWQGDGGNGSRRGTANSTLVDSSIRTLRDSRALVAPLPNLFKATFQQAHQLVPGEQWLKLRIATFDTGSRRTRKEVLEDFLEYVQQSSAVSMTELFSHQAHLFFIRLTSWFAVTLPMFYELSLQVKVFLAFLEFREPNFIRAFFESGAVATLMHTLSVNFDCTDEVRCLVLVALQKLAANGRYHKELLCSEGLIHKVMDCMSDGMQWETLKCAGRLLCEIFGANPRYQQEVIESLMSLLKHKLPLAQRVGTQAIISLLAGDRYEVPAILRSSRWHQAMLKLTLPMLESSDLRVGADAYCLICRLVLTFGCDQLLFDFCRSQIKSGDDISEWLRLELDAHCGGIEPETQLHSTGNQETPFGGWWKLSTERMYANISSALEQQKVAEGDSSDVRLVKRSNALFCEAFRKESEQILKWALLLFVLNRCPQLCHQLVDEGLTETLLMCVLDVVHPVQQAAALSELHRLRLISPLAQQIVSSVLVKPELLHATSLIEFMKVAKPSDLERARYKLRNVWNSLHCSEHDMVQRYGADEVGLQAKLLEKEITEVIGKEGMGFFLTDVNTADKAKGKKDKLASTESKPSGDDIVHRAGKDKFDVRRVPVLTPMGGQMGDEHSRIEMGPMEEIPFCGSLSSLIFDPLDISADEESPLIQELRTLEGFGTFRMGTGAVSLRRNVDLPGMAAKRPRALGFLAAESPGSTSCKGSHRASLAHTRALILRRVPPRGVEYLRPKQLAPLERPDSAGTEYTELSLHCGEIGDCREGQKHTGQKYTAERVCMHGGYSCQADHSQKSLLHNTSLAETSAGPEWMQEASLELPSSGPSMEFLSAGPSFMTDASDFNQQSQDDLCGYCSLEGIQEGPSAFVTEKSPICAVLEIPKYLGLDEDDDEVEKITAVQKRILKVAPVLAHTCMAFDPLENERTRENLGNQIVQLLHPKTRRLMEDLSSAGKFPKKKVMRPGKMPPLNLPNSFTYPSGSRSARTNLEGYAVEAPPVPQEEQEPPRKLLWMVSSGPNIPVAATAPGSMWQQLDEQHPSLQDAGDRLKAYFPASARRAAQ